MTASCTIPTLRELVTIRGASIMPQSSAQVVLVHSPCENGHAEQHRQLCQRGFDGPRDLVTARLRNRL